MHRKTWSSIVSIAAICLFAAPASAAEPGFYVTASLGMGEEDPESAGTNFANSGGIIHLEPVDVEVDDGNFAWSVGLGYRVNRFLAGEIEYIDFGTTHISEQYNIGAAGPFPFPTVVDLEFSSTVTGLGLSLLGTLPVGENFELFLRGGALFASREWTPITFSAQDQKFADTVWLAGAGVKWSFAKRWAIRAEYQQAGELSETAMSGETRVRRMSLSALFSL